jgi:alpha-L-rhamnosidase
MNANKKNATLPNHPLHPLDLKVNYLTNPLGIDDAEPRFFWLVHDERKAAVQSAYQILVSKSESALARDESDVWDSGKVASDKTVQIPFGASERLASCTRYFWKVRTWDGQDQPSPYSEVAWFETGVLNYSLWQGYWIGTGQHADGKELYQSPYLRKTFKPGKAMVSARLYISAAGIYEAYLNGKQIGNDVFTPGWTDYHNRIQYQVYDVTEMVKSGENALGAMLGEGWYSGYLAWENLRNHYGYTPSLYANLVLRYADGRKETIVTDTTWKWAPSAVKTSDIYRGEVYDARLEIAGWNEPGFDDSKWTAAKLQATPRGRLIASVSQPVRATMEIKPINVTEPTPDTYIFDLGQNITGVPRITLKAAAGTTIKLRHAEVLNPDGTLYVENLRTAPQVDLYTFKGDGVEVYQPFFTFHGFRYVEVTGLPPDASVSLDLVTGIVLHSDTPVVGTFECSDPLVNKLHQNVVWGQRGNFLDVPTDCPQRDERLGWMGDAQVFIRTASYNMDVSAFFSKWLVDVMDNQRPTGAFPYVVPDVLARVPQMQNLYGAAGWADAGVICPWVMYQVYGDTRILEKCYDAMDRYMQFLESTATDYLRPEYGFGDWLDVNDPTSHSFLGTAYFALCAKLMTLIAPLAGRGKDLKKWQNLEKNVVGAFSREFITPGGRTVSDSQTSYALALAFDLIPEKVRPFSGLKLAKLIEGRKNHISTGFLGTSQIMHALTGSGHHEVAAMLLLNETYPSWGYSIKNGATTIWERWDGWTQEKGFQNPSMNSFNHYAFGAVAGWMFMHLGGIDLGPDKPAYQHIKIAPKPANRITWTKASYKSINGMIEVAWKLDSGVLELEVFVPANTVATLVLPASSVEEIKESDQPLDGHADIRNVRQEPGGITFEVGAGRYLFEAAVG